MKHFWMQLMNRWNFLILPAIMKMGFWGLGLIAIVDTSSIPVPMDPLVALYVFKDQSHFWLYCLMASAGSAIGGLVPYGLGRAGGEIFLLKRIDRKKFEKMRERFEKQEFLAVMVPSMLPPPTPWKAFVFAAGVFEMRVIPFMLAVFTGRMIRWLVLSFLVMKLGPSAVPLIEQTVSQHLALFLTGLVLIFVAIGLWMIIKRRRSEPASEKAALTDSNQPDSNHPNSNQ